ncbi:hypothetical protein HSBAA_48680 [Vreelandella sulfidaeris]|uniref:Uncharacterized protein n=1 Tax=Vreelandella sulfidaeris TaxID=115553 RepID=A0A455UBI7_9GAMM|nr:hypothetical protein HSBAA_48680 [Halomonas sulfidaeris]
MGTTKKRGGGAALSGRADTAEAVAAPTPAPIPIHGIPLFGNPTTPWLPSPWARKLAVVPNEAASFSKLLILGVAYTLEYAMYGWLWHLGAPSQLIFTNALLFHELA